jgi:hypothetical protein
MRGFIEKGFLLRLKGVLYVEYVLVRLRGALFEDLALHQTNQYVLGDVNPGRPHTWIYYENELSVL